MITKTKIKRILATAWVIVLPFTSYATTQIWTGSVSGTWAFDSAVMWDEALTWTASGTISWITVSANVTPTLNMALSTNMLDLWTLNSSSYSTWTLYLEVWTNAVNWITVSAKSNSGWLTNLVDPSIQINNLTVDWIAESYKFNSSLSWAVDSTVVWYTRTSNLDTEINSNTWSIIYTTIKPEQTLNIDDVKFDVLAKSNAETPGWNYADTINFTVSGNF